MSGVIVVVVEHPEVALQTLATARALATLMGSARVNALAIRMPSGSADMSANELMVGHQNADADTRENMRLAMLRRAFDAFAVTARVGGITAEWAEVEGSADTLVGEWGRRSDFLILNRPTEREGVPDRLMLQAALFDTDRPVLVVPPGPARLFGERVAIAWRDDKRTIRAVLAALRLLSHAQEVHVLAGARVGGPEPVLPEILAEHGIEASLHVLPVGTGVFGDTLLMQTHRLGADMLVMGAFTHNLWHDLILGGVTRHMLAHADLPVLMRH